MRAHHCNLETNDKLVSRDTILGMHFSTKKIARKNELKPVLVLEFSRQIGEFLGIPLLIKTSDFGSNKGKIPLFVFLYLGPPL